MNDGDEHILWACSLLLIPPPPSGAKYRVKSTPMSLAEIPTPEWTKIVQDLASQMVALPSGFSVTEQQMTSLLARLEWATGQPPCNTCHHLKRRCLCASGGPTPMPHKNWSGGTGTSSTYNQQYPLPTRGTTTVSVSQSRAPANTVAAPPQGVVSPVWRQRTMEVQGTTHQPYLGGSVNYALASLPRATIRQPGPGSSQRPPQEPPAMDAPVVRTPILPGQLRPSTPYQFARYTEPLAYLQAAGRGRGIPRTTTPSQVSTPGASQSQGNVTIGQGPLVSPQGGDWVWLLLQRITLRTPLPRELLDPGENARNLLTNPTLRRSHPCVKVRDGERMRTKCMPISWLSLTPISLQKKQISSLHRCWITCGRSRAWWYWLKEDNPMEFGRLLNDLFQEVHNRRIPGLDTYVRWIKPGSWYHQSVLEREELNRCLHLQHAPQPLPNITRPSDATLHSYRTAYEKSLKTKKQVLKNQWIYAATLHLHGRTAEVDEIDPPRLTSATSTLTPAPTPSRSQQTVPMEVDRRESLSTSAPRSTATNRSLPRDQTRQSEWLEELVYSQAGGNATSRPTSNVSWGDQMSAEEGASTAAESDEWQMARSKSSKRRRDHSSDHYQQQRLRKEAWSPQPFPLRSHYEERVAQVLQLYEAAGQLEWGELQVGKKNCKESIPQEDSQRDRVHNQCCGDHDLRVLPNLLVPTQENTAAL